MLWKQSTTVAIASALSFGFISSNIMLFHYQAVIRNGEGNDTKSQNVFIWDSDGLINLERDQKIFTGQRTNTNNINGSTNVL